MAAPTTPGIHIEALTGGAKLIELENNILGLYQEMDRMLIAWQRDDMNRKYPFLRNVSLTSASTVIYPRSRTWKRTQRSKFGKARTRRVRVRRAPGAPKRPILRPVLLDMLKARVTAMVQDVVKWP